MPEADKTREAIRSAQTTLCPLCGGANQWWRLRGRAL